MKIGPHCIANQIGASGKTKPHPYDEAFDTTENNCSFFYALVGVISNKYFGIETSRVVSAYLIEGFKK